MAKPGIKPPAPRTTHVERGDRVKVIPTGALGTVVSTHVRSVVLELDEPIAVVGSSTRTYYSYPGELDVMPRVGKMGAQRLYAEQPGELADDA
jgi:hypothetical protein